VSVLPRRAGEGTACSAFTLIEIIAVIAVAGILLALLSGIAGHVRRRAHTGRARAQIERLQDALQEHMIENGAYPADLEAVSNRLSRVFAFERPDGSPSDVPVDPWGEPYQYTRRSPVAYTLYSKGPDRRDGTPADNADNLSAGR
jgi:general secretion pathway protein G